MAIGTGAGLAIAGGASLLGGLMGSKASKDAANAQRDAANQANQTQWDMFRQIQSQMGPYREAGYGSLGQLMGMAGSTKPFSFSASDMASDPGYQFRMDEANKALARRQAATGGFGGGGALKALSSLNQGLASQEYGNAYNRAFNQYNVDQDRQWNRWQSLANMGLGAQGQLNQYGMQTAGNVGQNLLGMGNANAAGIMGSANAWGGALNQMGNLGMMYGMGAFSGMPPQGAPMGYSTAAYNLPGKPW